MRILSAWLLGLGLATCAPGPSLRRRPSLCRSSPPTTRRRCCAPRTTREPHSLVHDDDDPKTARTPGIHKRRSWEITHAVPRVKLAYRYFSTVGLEKGVNLDFHAAALDYYPSSGYLRFGIDTELAFAGGRYDAWYLATGAALGLQYPGRVTPFLEGRFLAGLLGGSAAGATAVSYIYTGGIETGVELYVASRFFFTAAIGWVHPVYSGVDIDWVMAHPGLAPARKSFVSDAFTFKIGVGL